jgi:hypothetical protein
VLWAAPAESGSMSILYNIAISQSKQTSKKPQDFLRDQKAGLAFRIRFANSSCGIVPFWYLLFVLSISSVPAG